MKTLEIRLTKGYSALIDARDYLLVSQHKWQAEVRKRTVYASTTVWQNKRNNKIMMHRLILGLRRGDGVLTDHENRNGLDNRRRNIRKSTPSLNIGRALFKRNKSPYRGVCAHRDSDHGRVRWQARIDHLGQTIRLGDFKIPEEAARAYDAAAKWLRGEHAELNFP